jgi:hypothetical protein
MLLLAGVNYEPNRDSAGATHRVPALLALNLAIPVRDDAWIVENPRRRFK